MARYRSHAEGFTLLEALVALALLGAVVVVGLETIAMGMRARAHAAGYVPLRAAAELKLAELKTERGSELAGLPAVSGGRLEAPLEDVSWVLEVREDEPGSGLFRIDLAVQSPAGATLRISTYLNRYAELWASQRGQW